eukprot:g805.t1
MDNEENSVIELVDTFILANGDCGSENVTLRCEILQKLSESVTCMSAKKQIKSVRRGTLKYDCDRSQTQALLRLVPILNNCFDRFEPTLAAFFRGAFDGKDDKEIRSMNEDIIFLDKVIGVTLAIMSMHHIDQRLLMEELVDNVLKCLKSLLKRIVFPAVDKMTRCQLRAECSCTMSDSISRVDDDSVEASKKRIYGAEFSPRSLRVAEKLAIGMIESIFSKGSKYQDAILHDVLNILNRLPTSPKHLRMYRLTHDSQSIQMVSALVLRLAQSAASIADRDDADDDDDDDVEPSDEDDLPLAMFEDKRSEQASSDRRLRVISDSRRVLHFFISKLMRKCRSKDHGKSFFRIFDNIVQDFLRVLCMPEWPASSLAILISCEQLCQSLPGSNAAEDHVGQSCSTSCDHPNVAVSALRVLGFVSRRLQLEVLERKRDPTIEIESDKKCVVADGKPTDCQEVVNCVCGCTDPPNSEDVFMLDCDDCHEWFHGQCVGISAPRSPDDLLEFYCDRCLVRRQVKVELERSRKRVDRIRMRRKEMPSKISRRAVPRRKRKRAKALEHLSDDEASASSSSDEVVDAKARFRHHISRQLLLNYLTSEAHAGSQNAVFARRFLLSQWLSYDFKILGATSAAFDESREAISSQWNLPAVKKHRSSLSLSRERTMAICRSFAVDQTLRNLSEILLRRLLRTLMAARTSIRTEAVKAIGVVLSANPDIMGRNFVRDNVDARLRDKSIKVREAVLDLVGNHVVSRPELMVKYYEIIVGRLKDRGISVRKRAVTILKNVLTTQPRHAKKLDICNRLLELYGSDLISEEDSLQLSICDAFRHIWFHANRMATSNGEKMPSLANDDLANEFVALCEQGHLQKCGLLTRLYVSETSSTFAATAGRTNDSSDSKSDADVKLSCREVVRCLVVKLLRCEEDLATPKMLAPAAREMCNILRTMLMLAEVDPGLLARHLETVSIHIKSDPLLHRHPEVRSDLIIMHATKIVSIALPCVIQPDEDVVQKIVRDLRGVILSREPHVVETSVECFAIAARLLGSEGRGAILNLTQSLYRYLHSRRLLCSLENQSQRVINSLERALYTIGLICRFVDLERHKGESGLLGGEDLRDRSKEIDAVVPEHLAFSNVTESFFSLCCDFARMSHKSVRSQALRGICSLAVRYVRFALRAKTRAIISDTLLSDCDETCVVALDAFRMMVEADEVRLRRDCAEISAIAPLRTRRNSSSNLSAVKTLEARGVSYIDQVFADQTPESGMLIGALQEHQAQVQVLLWHPSPHVRRASLHVVTVLLRRGIMNPLTCATRLIGLQADVNSAIRRLSLGLLRNEHSKRPEIISCGLYEAVAGCFEVYAKTRRSRDEEATLSALGDVYSNFVRANRKLRGRFLRQMGHLFDDRKPYDLTIATTRISSICHENPSMQNKMLRVRFLHFLAVQLAKLPFKFAEEPLMLIHTLSRLASVRGESLYEELRDLCASEDNIAKETIHTKCLDAIAVLSGLRLRSFLQFRYGLSESNCQAFKGGASASKFDQERLVPNAKGPRGVFDKEHASLALRLTSGGEFAQKMSLRALTVLLRDETASVRDGAVPEYELIEAAFPKESSKENQDPSESNPRPRSRRKTGLGC